MRPIAFRARRMGLACDEVETENDFQKKCRKGAKFAAHTAFWTILHEISCLFSFGVGVFHPLSRRIVSTTHAPLRIKISFKYHSCRRRKSAAFAAELLMSASATEALAMPALTLSLSDSEHQR